jgi:Ca2+-binding EF-hand superfamily protein
MSYSDQQLRDAVDAVFGNYDTDNSGTLESTEVTNLINDALKQMNAGRQVSQQETNQFIKAIDSSGDGRIQKPELLEIFKKVLTHK